jgi:hypothetical protein
MSVTVHLNDEEQAECVTAATKRFRYHTKKDTQHFYGKQTRSIEEEVDSIGAEIATANVLGITWKDNENALVDREQGDLGDKIDVRFTKHINGRLLLHKRDFDDHLYFLTVGEFPRYEIIGYITGKRGKSIGEWKELQRGRPCYVIDQHQLKSFNERLS